MSCPEFESLLEDYVDGELGASERTRVDSHLAGCARCRRVVDESHRLRRAVAALPPGIAPSRDLLPAIRHELLRGEGPRNRRAWPRWIAAAACLALVSMAAWLVLRTPRQAGVRTASRAPAEALVASEATLAEFEAAGLEYERASERLLATIDERREELSPATRRVVEENLKIIDGAIEEVRKVLESDPSNARNGRALNALYRQKVEFLWRVSRMSS